MSECHIVLADGPRLPRELIKQVLDKAVDLQVIGEAKNQAGLARMLDEFDVQWVIICLETDEMPAWVDMSVNSHSMVKFLIVSLEGGRIQIKWSEACEKTLNEPSLDDLIAILHDRVSLPDKRDHFA